MARDVCRCGRKIEQLGRGKPRDWCTTCRPPRPGGKRPPAAVLGLVPPAAPAGDESEAGAITEATLAELDAAQRSATARGRRAVLLARLLDRGGYTAAGAAALARAHEDALTKALAGAKGEPDALDAIGATWGVKASG